MPIDPTACGANFTYEELQTMSIGVDADGLPFQRMVLVTDTGDDFAQCAGAPFDPKSLFGVDSNGKVALRVSIDGL